MVIPNSNTAAATSLVVDNMVHGITISGLLNLPEPVLDSAVRSVNSEAEFYLDTRVKFGPSSRMVLRKTWCLQKVTATALASGNAVEVGDKVLIVPQATKLTSATAIAM